jgi:hypothetical protein
MYQLLLSDFNETLIFSTDFRKKFSNIKFNENTSYGCRGFLSSGLTYKRRLKDSLYAVFWRQVPQWIFGMAIYP